MTCELSVNFSRRPVIDETIIKSSSNNYNSIVGINASQLNLIQCVNIYQEDCARADKLTRICSSSKLDITEQEFSRI